MRIILRFLELMSPRQLPPHEEITIRLRALRG